MSHFAASPLVPGEQTAHNSSPSPKQRAMPEDTTAGASLASEQSASASTQRSVAGTVLLVLSIVNFLVAAGLLIWVLVDRYWDGSSGNQSAAITRQATATPLPVVALQATPTQPAARPTDTRVPPSATVTPLPPSTTPTSVPPTATSVPPTNTAAPPPATDTPAPPPPPPPAATRVPPRPKPRPPTATPVREIVYIVRPGDTLTGIAARFRTTVNAIMQRNGLRSTVIYAGQRLIIPLR